VNTITKIPKKRTTIVATNEKIKHRWSLAVSYWRCGDILETFAVGKTKKEATKNWFLQYYRGMIPEGACFPSGRNLIFLSWVKFIPAK
jgi:hypothetical protein